MSTGILAPPRRIEFSTTSEDEARDFIHRGYGSRLQVRGSRDTDWRLAVHDIDAGQIRSGVMRLPADVHFVLDESDLVGIGTVLDGGLGVQDGATTYRWGAGGVYLGNAPGLDCTWDTHELLVSSITMRAALLTDVAGREQRPRSWRFTGTQAHPGGADRWQRATRFVDGLLAEPETAASPLLIGSAARLLAATALTIFPNTLVTDTVPADSVDAHPGTLARATAYIDAHCDLDISLGDVARAACVTPRAVQMAFRRHLDTTPTAYLRQVRLEQAHRQLRDAAPGDGVTVTAVAARWGFTPSRFTERYRAAFGVLPSHTLRT
jgi:AraC-like DNA-binding protein